MKINLMLTETELNENSNNIDLELVYLDILNDDDVMEIQPIEDANDSLKSNLFIIVYK